jgi:hypothetical protein
VRLVGTLPSIFIEKAGGSQDLAAEMPQLGFTSAVSLLGSLTATRSASASSVVESRWMSAT